MGAMPGIVKGGCTGQGIRTPLHRSVPWRRVFLVLALGGFVLGLAAALMLMFVR